MTPATGVPGHPAEYLERWEIELDATSPLDAVSQALSILRDATSTATVFTAIDPAGTTHTIDLDQPPLDHRAARPTIEDPPDRPPSGDTGFGAVGQRADAPVDGPTDADSSFVAEITAQAWYRDLLCAVDPPGDTVWDCTRAVQQMSDHSRRRLLDEIATHGEALDRDDVLRHDPDAPPWVREWSGPFDITVWRQHQHR